MLRFAPVLFRSIAIMLALSVPAASPAGGSSVRLREIRYVGDVSGVWKDRFSQRVRAGLGIPAGPRQAAGEPSWVAEVTVTRTDADYQLRLQATKAATGEILAEITSACELCGEGEVAERLQTHAAKLASQLEASLGAPAMLVLRTRPAGALVELDGEPSGVTPAELEVSEGPHEVTINLAGYESSTLSFESLAGLSVTREIVLQPVEAETQTTSAKVATVPIILTSIGLAAIATGAVLLALHGREVRNPCEADADGDCRRLYGTRTPGAVVLGIGGVFGIVGGSLWIRHAKRHRNAPRRGE